MTSAIPTTNRFKLGTFCVNTDGVMTLTTVPERWQAEWDQIVEVTQLIDAAGFSPSDRQPPSEINDARHRLSSIASRCSPDLTT